MPGHHSTEIAHNGGDPMAQRYDTAFKLTLQHVDVAMRELVGSTVSSWKNIEFPQIRAPRADLLGETTTTTTTKSGQLVHIELQSGNSKKMAIRMLEYGLAVLRKHHRYPAQVCLYVGEKPARMKTELRSPNLKYSFRLVDVRDLDGERLLKSGNVDDNIIALLTRIADQKKAVRLVLRRIKGLPQSDRQSALDRLVILAGLRKMLGTMVEEEVRKVPILNDILQHEILGREYKKGRQEGRKEGRQEGRQEGELTILRRQIEKRFGSVPNWAGERLEKLSAKELEELSIRLLDAKSIESLLKIEVHNGRTRVRRD
jgi:predicted transposase YdaD